MKLRFLYSILAIAVTAAGLISWANHAPAGNRYEYFTALVSPSEDVPSVTVPATITGENQFPVYARTSGVITKTLVRLGELVSKGQPLLALDGSAEDVELYTRMQEIKKELRTVEKVREALDDLRSVKEKNAQLRAQRRAMEAELLRVLRDYLSYDSLLEDLKKRSVDKFIFSPAAGFVAELNARPGTLVSENRQEFPLVTIAPDIRREKVKLLAQLEIPEEVAYRVRAGQTVSIHPLFSDKRSATALITDVAQVAMTVDKRRFFPATAELQQPFEVSQFRYGVGALADVDLGGIPGGAWIPTSALEIKMPPGVVKRVINLVPENDSKRTSVAQDKSSTPQPEFSRSPAGRTAANSVSETSLNRGTVYLLTGDEQVVEATVSVIARNDRTAMVEASNLSGYRVITHFRKKLSGMASLLGD